MTICAAITTTGNVTFIAKIAHTMGQVNKAIQALHYFHHTVYNEDLKKKLGGVCVY